MSNGINERKIIERLSLENDMELMQLEISRMLEEELSKPVNEVDMQLVDELLDMLEAERTTEKERAQGWNGIQKGMRAHRQRRWVRALSRTAAGIVVLAALFFVSFETAKAFRWTHLLKLLAPVAETFGIYSTSSMDSKAPIPNDIAYTDAETEFSQQTIFSLEEMPAEKDGFRVIPQWLPERFAFQQGAVYEDPDMMEISVSYQAGDDILVIRMMLSYNDESVFGYEYERTLNEPLTEDINGRELSYYHNTDSERMSASWIDQGAHYQISGNISHEELTQIVGSMMD
ncbi:MAG: DUF4367 domain-containing protein [Clostridia bacterium]|nr:DUF4367 domain-containing protein [Clostridia bacterium]